jgi:hypothetical protein
MITPHSARRMGENSASDSAAQIVVRIAMVSGKIRTGKPQNLLDEPIPAHSKCLATHKSTMLQSG